MAKDYSELTDEIVTANYEEIIKDGITIFTRHSRNVE